MTAVGTGSLFKIQLHGLISGQQTINRFFYYGTAVPGTYPAAEVQTAFDTAVGAAWVALANLNWSATLLETDELTSISNFFSGIPTFLAGTVAGDSLGPEVCYSILYHRQTKITRNGRKRIAGVSESLQSSGSVVLGGPALLTALATAFAALLFIPTPATSISPVIIRKTFAGTPPVLNPPSLWEFNGISSVTGEPFTSTQNSRKRSSPP